MTDTILDAVTGLLAVGTGGLAVVAYLGMSRAGRDADESRSEMREQRRADDRRRSREFQARVVLDISSEFEAHYVNRDINIYERADAGPDPLRAKLAALPLGMLPRLRTWLDVYPSVEGRVDLLKATDAKRRNLLLRQEIAETLHELLDIPPQEFGDLRRQGEELARRQAAEVSSVPEAP